MLGSIIGTMEHFSTENKQQLKVLYLQWFLAYYFIASLKDQIKFSVSFISINAKLIMYAIMEHQEALGRSTICVAIN